MYSCYYYVCCVPTGAPTLQQLMEALKKQEKWFLFGAMLGVPVSKLKEIESKYPNDSDRCKLEMLQYWLDTKLGPTWNEVTQALEKADQLTLAAQVKHEYLLTEGTMCIQCLIMCVSLQYRHPNIDGIVLQVKTQHLRFFVLG